MACVPVISLVYSTSCHMCVPPAGAGRHGAATAHSSDRAAHNIHGGACTPQRRARGC
eukprot:COSAG01_NODE_29823_length_628_cov_5.190926_1_plen_56_part_10